MSKGRKADGKTTREALQGRGEARDCGGGAAFTCGASGNRQGHESLDTRLIEGKAKRLLENRYHQ